MKATFELEDPSNMEATMTISMKVKQWEELDEQLSSAYPSWQFSSIIRKLVDKARATFRERSEDE